MPRKIDWIYWRDRYIQGSDSLDALSRVANAPSLDALKKRCSSESWQDLRKEYIHQKAQQEALKPEAKQAVMDAQRIIDASEVIVNHKGLARALQGKSAQALKALDPLTLKPSEIAQFIKLGTELERLSMGMETERTATTIDFTQLSDAELEAIARGESAR